jgi:uncharacterized protein YjeT (DUF2065 family)
MNTAVTFREMLRRLLRAEGQGRAAKTVEIYGWIVLIEGAICMLWPQSVATALGIPALADQALNYFRLAGVWVAGIGLLYLLSGRLNATGFVFSTLLDRPLVLPLLGVLWYFGMVAGTIALVAGLQDLLTCLWTFLVWRREFAIAGTAYDSR